MKLPTYKRLQTADFDTEYKELIDGLGFSVNDGIGVLFDALNRKVSLKDNIAASVKDVELSVDSAGQVVNGGIFNVDIPGPYLGLEIMKADNLTNSAIYPTAAPWATWNVVTNGIQIIHVSGLPAKNNFKLRVLIWGT